MKPITIEERDDLDLNGLVERMDEILITSNHERYGITHPPPQGLVSEIINTKRASELPEEERRCLAYIVYDYLVQLELTGIAAGIGNRLIFNKNYDAEKSWESPSFFMRYEVLNQYQIIASRSAMEIFIDILHLIESGERIRSTKSKLRAFRKWLLDIENPFHYFALLLLTTYKFDRKTRAPEIHGTPRSTRRILQMKVPDNNELNHCHRLSNALMNSWKPLLEILDGKKPNFMYVEEDQDESWLTTYTKGSEEEIMVQLEELFSEFK